MTIFTKLFVCIAATITTSIISMTFASGQDVGGGAREESNNRNSKRSDLLERLETSWLAGDVENALQLSIDALEWEIDNFGEASDRVAWRIGEMANLQLELGQLHEAQQSAQRAERLTQHTHPPTSWQCDETKRFTSYVKQLSEWAPEKRAELLNCSRLFTSAYLQYDYVASLTAASTKARLLGELLGDRHLYRLQAVINVQDTLISQGQLDTVGRQLANLASEIELASVTPNQTQASLNTTFASYASTNGQLDLALKYYDQAIALYEQTGWIFIKSYFICLANKAVLLEKEFHYEEALEFYERAEEAARQSCESTVVNRKTNRSNHIKLLTSLGHQAIRDQDFEVATGRFQAAHEVAIQLDGQSSFRCRTLLLELDQVRMFQRFDNAQLSVLAIIHDKQTELDALRNAADWPAANLLAIEICQQCEQLLGAESLFTTRAHMAIPDTSLDNVHKLQMYRDLEGIYLKLFGPKHPEYAELLTSLSQYSEDAADAKYAQKAAEIYGEVYTVDSEAYVTAILSQARLLLDTDRNHSGELLHEALLRWDSLHIMPSKLQVDILFYLARWYKQGGRFIDARQYLNQAITKLKTLPESTPTELITYVNELAVLEYGLEHFEPALTLYLEAIELARKSEDISELFIPLYNAGDLCREMERFEQAELILQELADFCFEGHVNNRWCFDGTLRLIAIYRLQTQFDEADVLLQRLWNALNERKLRVERVQILKLHLNYVAILRDRGSKDEAVEAMQEAWKTFNRDGLENSFDSETLLQNAREELPQLQELAAVAIELDDWSTTALLYEAIIDRLKVLPETKTWELTSSQLGYNEARQELALNVMEREAISEANRIYDEFKAAEIKDRRAEFLIKIISLSQTVYGETHRCMPSRWEELADLYLDNESLFNAEQAYIKSLNLRKSLQGLIHPDTAETYYKLSIIERRLGRYDASLVSLEHSRLAIETIYGSNTPQLAKIYYGLAYACYERGSFAEALQYAHKSNGIYRESLGEISERYANSLKLISAIYDNLGDQQLSSDTLIQSHNIIKEVYGESSKDYADSLLMGATQCARYQSTYDFAEKLFLQVMQIYEDAGLANHPDYANALNGYGNLCSLRKDYNKALELYCQVLDIREKNWGDKHPWVAQAHSQIGSMALKLGDLERAKRELNLSLSLRRELFGGDTHESINVLSSLATLHMLEGKSDQALAYLNESLRIEQLQIANSISLGSQEALSGLIYEGKHRLSLLLSIAASAEPSTEQVESAFAWTLSRKGLVLDVACQIESAQRRQSFDPRIANYLYQIENQNQALANTAIQASNTNQARVDSTGSKSPEEFARVRQQIIAHLQNDGLAIDATFGGISMIRKALPAGSALLEFVVSETLDLNYQQHRERHGLWTDDHLFAFWIPSDGTGKSRLVDLGPIDVVSEEIDELRAHIKKASGRLRIYTEESLVEEYATISGGLFEHLLGSFNDELSNIDRLIIAPDGDLHFLPFAALTQPSQRYLIEDCVVTYVSSGRDILRKHAEVGQRAVILADPDYNLAFDQREQDQTPADGSPTIFAMLAMRGIDDTALRNSWIPLPGARLEANEIATLLEQTNFAPVKLYVGKQAVEEVFKSARSPRILHIATHGFYVPYQTPESEQLRDASTRSSGTLSRLRADSNPLLRSGIVLAGANQRPQTDATTRFEDGWLTAQEIAAMDFRNTELVVLSACESGLGESEVGQGVHGLRRSFLIAGAHSLMTSLFEVPDQETRELMKHFYTSLAQHDDKSQAIRDAQLKMIQQRRQDNGAAHPFFWASFILLGDN